MEFYDIFFRFFLGSRDHKFTKVKWYLAVNCALLLHNDTKTTFAVYLQSLDRRKWKQLNFFPFSELSDSGF